MFDIGAAIFAITFAVVGGVIADRLGLGQEKER